MNVGRIPRSSRSRVQVLFHDTTGTQRANVASLPPSHRNERSWCQVRNNRREFGPPSPWLRALPPGGSGIVLGDLELSRTSCVVTPQAFVRLPFPMDLWYGTVYTTTLCTNRTTTQASSTRYLLRLVTVVVVTVTSFTIVPSSSCSDSTCSARVADCPAASPSYGGRELEPRVVDDECEGVNVPSTSAGINFQV